MHRVDEAFARGGAPIGPVTQWGETASSCKSSTWELSRLGAPPEMLPSTAAGEGATQCAESPTDVATTGWVGAVEAKVGTVEGLEETELQSAAGRVGEPERVTRVLDCAVVIVVLLPDFMSVGVSGIVFARFKSLGD